MADLEDRIPLLQSEIVVRVESIKALKEDKKVSATSFNESIKALEAEQDNLIQELNATKDQVKQDILVGAADEILDQDASPASAGLSLID